MADWIWLEGREKLVGDPQQRYMSWRSARPQARSPHALVPWPRRRLGYLPPCLQAGAGEAQAQGEGQAGQGGGQRVGQPHQPRQPGGSLPAHTRGWGCGLGCWSSSRWGKDAEAWPGVARLAPPGLAAAAAARRSSVACAVGRLLAPRQSALHAALLILLSLALPLVPARRTSAWFSPTWCMPWASPSTSATRRRCGTASTLGSTAAPSRSQSTARRTPAAPARGRGRRGTGTGARGTRPRGRRM